MEDALARVDAGLDLAVRDDLAGDRDGDRLDPVPRPPSGAPEPRDRLDVARAVGLGHRGEHRGEAPAARARVRGARLPEGRVQDRRAQRARAPCARGAAGASSRGSIASTCWSATARTGTRPGTASSTTTGRQVREQLRSARSSAVASSPPRHVARSIDSRGPVSRQELEQHSMIESVNVIGSGRVGSAVSARLAERGHRARRARAGARASLRPGPGDRRGRARALHRARGWPTSAVRRRSPPSAPRPPVRRPSAADVHAPPGPGAARRRLGGRHGRERRGVRGRHRLAETARPAAVPPRATRTERPTTRARRSRRTTSSRCAMQPARCSRRRERRRRRSTR